MIQLNASLLDKELCGVQCSTIPGRYESPSQDFDCEVGRDLLNEDVPAIVES